jgi:hypothetical protein
VRKSGCSLADATFGLHVKVVMQLPAGSSIIVTEDPVNKPANLGKIDVAVEDTYHYRADATTAKAASSGVIWP